MNEAETRAEHIDPALKAAGWGVIEGSRIQREYPITLGRIETHGRRGKALTADYILVYRNTKLAVIEAKAWDEPLTEGVAQAKNYAAKLAIRHAYSTNGQGICAIDMQEGVEGEARPGADGRDAEDHQRRKERSFRCPCSRRLCPADGLGPRCRHAAGVRIEKGGRMTIDKRIEFLMQSTESHDRQIGELTEKVDRISLTVDRLSATIETLSGTMGQLLASVTTLAGTVGVLADVANNHERRISRIEGTA